MTPSFVQWWKSVKTGSSASRIATTDYCVAAARKWMEYRKTPWVFTAGTAPRTPVVFRRWAASGGRAGSGVGHSGPPLAARPPGNTTSGHATSKNSFPSFHVTYPTDTLGTPLPRLTLELEPLLPRKE